MSPRRTEKRHLHFNLSSSPAGVTHTLHLGHRKFEIKPHDDASRAAIRGANTLFQHVKDMHLTHFHPEVDVSAESIQSYWITHPSLSGRAQPTLAGCGVMVPKAVAQRSHKRLGHHRGLFSSKARRLGLVPHLPPPAPKVRRGPFGDPEAASQADVLAAAPQDQPQPPKWLDDGDLADFTDFTDAAAYLVYHHSNLITLTSASTSDSGSDTAVQILAIIENTQSFAVYDNHGDLTGGLVWELLQQGYAQNPDSEYLGFCNGTPWVDENNQPMKNKVTGQEQWWWVPTDTTSKAMAPVVKQALRAVNDVPDLDGTSFKIDYGRHSASAAPTSSNTPAPAPRSMALAEHPRPSLSPRKPKTLMAETAGGYTWQLRDPDYHNGRQIVLDQTRDREITFTLNNSYFRHLGIFVRFLDQAGNPIVLDTLGAQRPIKTRWDTTWDAMLNWVSSRGRIMGIPTEDASSAQITVKLPDSAASMRILAGGLGFGSIPSTYKGVEAPGSILTGVIDLGLPSFFLACGVAADQLESACHGAIAGLVLWLLESYPYLDAIKDLPSDGTSKSNVYTDWAAGVLQSVFSEAPGELISLLECYAEVSTAEIALECIPILGQALYAVNTAATITDLTETTADVLMSPWVITDQLTSTLHIAVAVAKDPADYEFPASAVRMDITVTLAGSIAYTASIPLGQYPGYPTPDPMSLTHTFTDIPSGGHVQVDVHLLAKNGWAAASGSWSGPNLLNGQPAVQANITLKEIPVPLTTATQYHHLRILQYDSQTNPQHHVWKDTQTPPTATESSLGGNKAQTLNALGSISINMTGVVGYSWSGLSPTLLRPGQSGPPQLLSTAQTINVGGGAPDDILRILVSGSNQAGYNVPIFLAEDLLGPAGGLHFIVAPAVDPTTGKSEYHAFRIELTGNSPIDLSAYKSWGRFASATIDAISVHPRGFLLALNSSDEKVELLELPPQPYAKLSNASYATQTGGQGSYIGRLHGATAICATKDGNGFLVLEAVNKRIQIFSVNGTSIPNYFGHPDPWIPLDTLDPGLTINYLSMALEETGFIYLLSSVNPGTDPSQYRLDIFDPTGAHLTRTTGVPAAQLTVDKFRVVYTENYQLIIGPNQRPEPSISEWVAVNP